MNSYKEYVGEFIGTLILVLFGCGAVAVSVLFGMFNSLLEVAIIWGFGVAIAIFTTRNYGPAHLNPAVSLAMSYLGKLAWKKLPMYIACQTLGAFTAGCVLYALFSEAIKVFENTHAIVRGSAASYKSALYFGEFFPNPGLEAQLPISIYTACFAEFLGTFLLVYIILKVTEKAAQVDNSTPLVIGVAVSVIICLVAPFTQAGLNPARDFGPRMVAYFMGWKNAAFPVIPYSFFTVYIAAPLLGGMVAGFCHKKMLPKA